MLFKIEEIAKECLQKYESKSKPMLFKIEEIAKESLPKNDYCIPLSFVAVPKEDSKPLQRNGWKGMAMHRNTIKNGGSKSRLNMKNLSCIPLIQGEYIYELLGKQLVEDGVESRVFAHHHLGYLAFGVDNHLGGECLHSVHHRHLVALLALSDLFPGHFMLLQSTPRISILSLYFS